MENRTLFIIDSENLLEEIRDQLPPFVNVFHSAQQLEDQTKHNIKEAFILMSAQNSELKKSLFELDPKKIIVISNVEDQLNIANLLYPTPLYHLVGHSSQLSNEICKTLLKIQEKNIWGIEKYLNEDALIKSVEIFHSKDTQAETNELLEQIDTSLYFESPKDYLSVIANELISNAFYHMQEAPTTDRTQSIFVSHPQAVELRVGIDQQRIALSVMDHSGTLTRDMVVKSLERSYRERTPKQRTPGAGLGLYLAFQHSNQLIFNRAANKQTEIIAVIEASKRYLKYKQRVTSFHFFEEDSYV